MSVTSLMGLRFVSTVSILLFLFTPFVFSQVEEESLSTSVNVDPLKLDKAHIKWAALNIKSVVMRNSGDSLKAELESLLSKGRYDSPENYEFMGHLLDQAAMHLALHNHNKKEESDSGGPDRLQEFSDALSALGHSRPSNYNEMVKLAELNQSAPDIKTYMAKLKDFVSVNSPYYKDILKESYDPLLYTSDLEVAKLYLDELAKVGIDQEFLAELVLGAITGHEGENPAWLSLLAEYFDFETPLVGHYGPQSILCSVMEPLREFAEGVPSEVPLTEKQQGYAQYTKEKITKEMKALIEHGASTETVCASRMSFLQEVEKLKVLGLLDDDFLMKRPCLISGIEGLSDLCDIAKAISYFTNALNRDGPGATHMVESMSEGKCDFIMLDSVVEASDGMLSREIKLTISPKASSKEFVLTGKNKEEFLKKFEALRKAEKLQK